MSEARDAPFVQRFRKSLEQTLANYGRLLADAAHPDQRRPDGVTPVTSDELVEMQAIQERTIKALAALDAGEDILPSPAN